MTKDFNVIIERDEAGYYIASVPELPKNQFIGVQRIAVEV